MTYWVFKPVSLDIDNRQRSEIENAHTYPRVGSKSGR